MEALRMKLSRIMMKDCKHWFTRFSSRLFVLLAFALTLGQTNAHAQLAYTFDQTLEKPDWFIFNMIPKLGDVDGDGDMDVMIGYLHINNGDGTFTADNTADFGHGFFADLDGDGDLDWVNGTERGRFRGANSPSHPTHPIHATYQNDGNGNFTLWQRVSWLVQTDKFGPYTSGVGDVNGDGKDDIIFPSVSNLRAHELAISNGDGTFTLRPVIPVSNWAGYSTLGDIDGDGDLDLVTSSDSHSRLGVYENDGFGTFTRRYLLTGLSSLLPKIGDLDGDGFLDIASRKKVLLLGDGAFGFTPVVGGGIPANWVPMELIDLDFDGDLDYAVDKIAFFNNGGGGTDGAVRTAGRNSSWLAYGDLDGDGDIDTLHWSGKIYLASGVTPTPSNQAPIADAGVAQDIFLSETAPLKGSASSDPDGDSLTYTWAIDSAPTGSNIAAILLGANTDTATLVPDVIGQYIISLVVNDGSVDSAADTVIINVIENLPPVANATGVPLSGDAPLLVGFDTVLSSDPEGGVLTFSWSFGDSTSLNNISTLSNPSHNYITPGTYTTIVTVTDDFFNTDQASVEITVTAPNTPPSADATATPASGEAPHNTQLMANATDPEGNPLSYIWDFGDGSPVSTVANPLHTYNAPGTYEATVTVSDGEFTVTSMVPISVSSALKINVCEAKVNFGKPGKVKDKLNFKVNFDFGGMLSHGDEITVIFDGVTIIEAPFSSFKIEADEPGKYKFKEKNVHIKLDFNKGEMKVSRHKMLLGGIDNSNGVDVFISFGLSGTDTDHFVMKEKGHHKDGGKKKLSFKDKCGKDKHKDKHDDDKDND